MSLHPSSMCDCDQCRPHTERLNEIVNRRVTVETGATVGLLQTMVHDKDEQIRRLSEELGRLKGENDRLHEEMRARKRKSRKVPR